MLRGVVNKISLKSLLWSLKAALLKNAAAIIKLKMQNILITGCSSGIGLQTAKTLKENDAIDKINIASLGNILPDLHVHVIGRKKNDRAWPGAIWGTKDMGVFQTSQKA